MPLRVYTDASVPVPVVDLLIKLGWDVETAEDAVLTGKIDDTIWVVYARQRDRIAITFDELKAEQGARVSCELRLRGGIPSYPRMKGYQFFQTSSLIVVTARPKSSTRYAIR